MIRAPNYGRPWDDDDYVVALHYYFQNRQKGWYANPGVVKELAALLKRSPASIVMRMENFTCLDPEVENRKGLENAGPLCREIFSKWAARKDELRICAEFLIEKLHRPTPMELFEQERASYAFDKYDIVEHLGEGASGNVFLCVDVVTRKQYAIKVIGRLKRFDDETRYRFIREMKILREIQHENIIKLYESNLDEEESYPAYVMDLAQCSLAAYLERPERPQKRPYLDSQEAIRIVRSVAAALHALHTAKKRVIHRDVNPNNILLLGNGTWVLADFGLAKYAGSTATTETFGTEHSVARGTVNYAAPEQRRDFRRTDERTDIFALGRIIWTLFSTSWGDPSPHGLPSKLAAVYSKATAYDFRERYQTVAELLPAFEQGVVVDLTNSADA